MPTGLRPSSLAASGATIGSAANCDSSGAEGAESVSFTPPSTASILAMPVNREASGEAVFGSRTRSILATTSCAVTARPLWNFAVRSLNV